MNADERRTAYLDDLGRLLQPLPAADRIGVIDGVRTRIDRAVNRLGHDASDGEMAGILAGIGSPDDVAEDALASAPPTASATTSAPLTSASFASGAATAASSDAETRATPSTSSGSRYDLSGIPALDWPDEPAPRQGLTKRWVPLLVGALIFLGGFFLLFLLPAIVLIIGVLFLWVSPLWSTSEKAIGTAVPTLGLGAFLPLLALGSGSDGNPAFALLGLVGFAAGIAALIWFVRRGLIASRRVDAESPAAVKKKR